MSRSESLGSRPARGRPRSGKREGGFTLVELLVALGIFAILSAFAYRGLDAMLRSREALQVESRKWRDVTLLVGRVERDVAAVLPGRKAISPLGVAQAPLSSVIETAGVRDGLGLTRSGVALQESALAAPQRVAYRKVADRVERITWYGVDAAPRDEGTAVTLLQGVSALDFRFMTPEGEWRTGWAPPGADSVLPAAVELTLQLGSGEKIVRVFDLPRRAPS
jgi:general secretion pathway protein J